MVVIDLVHIHHAQNTLNVAENTSVNKAPGDS